MLNNYATVSQPELRMHKIQIDVDEEPSFDWVCGRRRVLTHEESIVKLKRQLYTYCVTDKVF